MRARFAKLLLLCLITTAALGPSACAARPFRQPEPPAAISGNVTVAGSETAQPLLRAAKQQFEKVHPQVTVNIDGGGSLQGLERVIKGTADIGASQSDATKEQERVLDSHRVAITPYVIIVHRDLPLNRIALDKAGKIFSGEITNWEELGGYDARIRVIARPKESGAHITLLTRVLEGRADLTRKATIVATNKEMLETVAKTPGSIGYVDLPTFDPEQAKSLQIDNVPFSPEIFAAGMWPFYAFEQMYTKGEPAGPTRAFLDFLLSREFQHGPVTDLKYVPIKGFEK